MTVKTNRLFNFIIGLSLGLYLVTGSIFSIINDTNIDLAKSKYVIGRVTFVDVRQIQNFTIRWTSYSRVFYFKLKNSNQNFAVHRTYEVYTDLQSNIKVGDTVEVYYRSSIMDYNRHVFQVEKDGNILVDYKDYNEKASEWAGIGLFLGIIILISFIMWYKKFNLIKFLNSLVEGKVA
jgi:hypothetical protein